MSDWRKVGDTEYREVEPADIIGCLVRNADQDSVFLSYSEKTFVIYLNGQDNPIHEYRKVS